MKAEGLKSVFSKRYASKIWGGVSEVRFKKKLDSFTLETSESHLIRNFLPNCKFSILQKKTQLLHLENVEKPPHPQFFAQRAPEGLNASFNAVKVVIERRKVILSFSNQVII